MTWAEAIDFTETIFGRSEDGQKLMRDAIETANEALGIETPESRAKSEIDAWMASVGGDA